MNPLDLILRGARRVRAAVAVLRGVTPSVDARAPRTPPHGSHPMRQVPTLSEWDAEDVLSALQAHAQGQFRASAMLADYLGQSDAVAGVLDTLRRSVVGLPFDVVAPQDTPDPERSARIARQFRRAWRRVLSRGAAAEVVKWASLMGFCVCERVYRLDPRSGRWSVRLKPWHPMFTRWDWQRGCFVVLTSMGEELVTEDSQKWCLFTDLEESRPWMSGAVRCIGILALICWWLDRDGTRWSERHGLPPLGAKVPMAESEGPRADRFLADLEDLGSEPIMRLPQGDKDSPSFDIEWKELKNATAWQGFLEPGRDVRARVATVLIGQPLTSTAGVGGSGSYGLGKVHAVVRQDVIESYAALLGTTREHAVLPWMRLNETADRDEAEAIAPCPTYDASPPADAKAAAEASRARAEMVTAWRNAGVDVDVEAEAKLAGVTFRAAPTDPAAGAKSAPAKYDHINFVPPQGVADAAQRGLDLYDDGLGGDGLVPSTIRAARRLAQRLEVAPDRVVEMRAWFARHEADRKPDWGTPPVTPGYVAWMLWGGDAGQTWAEKVAGQMEAADAEEDS